MTSSSLSKRKIEDYPDDVVSAINPPTTMRKDHPTLPHPSPSALQFFVRILSDHTLVLHADSRDSVRSIHERIHSLTGIPTGEQRLIYRGKQLRWEQTLADCRIQNDANLHLVGRMLSTGHPQAWQLVNDIVSLVFHLLKHNTAAAFFPARAPPKSVKSMLNDFLTMTPRQDGEQSSGHLQIFSASSAPAALVMLYVSSSRINRGAGEEAIKHFVNFCKTNLPKSVCCHCVPIVLEFCRLLSRAAGVEDSLYGFCRSSLGTMVEYSGVGLKDVSVGSRDLFPFVSELAVKISHCLVVSAGSSTFLVPPMADVIDFTAFVGHVRNGIKWDEGFRGLIRVPLTEEMCYADEAISLNGIFFDLLSRVEKCLVKIEEHLERAKKLEGETLFVGCQYLALLKELNSISKLYYGCEEGFWETMKRTKIAFCYLIVKCAKRSDDHRWIFEHKEVTNFEARRHLAMMLLPDVKDEYEELHEMLIDRANLLPESFEYIINADADSLRAGLFMEFKNEEATGPGVLREWFFLVCQAIFNPENALFVACPNDRRRFFPNPVSKVEPMNSEFFTFSGKVIALALMHKVQVGIVFDRVFFSRLAGDTITLEHIKDADPCLYNSCKQILEMDPEAVDQDALGLTFVDEIEELGSRTVVELCPGGKSLVVNSENRKKYVDSLIRNRFVKATEEQVKRFSQGFADIMSCGGLQKSFFRCLDPEDLDLMLHGSESEISVDDWKAHTECHGFKKTDPQISWFWKIVANMTKEQKKVLLFFWTSIKYLPCEGFSGLASRLYIYKNCDSIARLPSSHTCFYRLCFPAYPTKKVMGDRLRIITQEHVGCSFGTW